MMASGPSDSTLAVSEKSIPNFSNAEPPICKHSQTEAGQEDAEIPVEDVAAAPDVPLRTPHAKRANSGHPASVQRSRSYGDGQGYTVFGEDEEAPPKRDDDEREPGKQYEVQWDGDNDSMNPRCMSKGRKWIIVAIVSLSSTCVTCTSSMYTSTYAQLTAEFHVSRVVATLGLSLFVMGLGIGPMVGISLSCYSLFLRVLR